MKVDQEILKQAVSENLSRPKEERPTCKQLGETLGVSGPRVSQIASGLRPKAEVIPTPTQDEANAQEAA